MADLHGRGMTNRSFHSSCAFQRDRSEDPADGDAEREMPHLALRSGDERERRLPVNGIGGKHERAHCSAGCVSTSIPSLARSLLRGYCDALRRCAVLLSGLLSQSESGPLSRMHGLALGSRAHSHGFAQV
jgi:hypothetical protein